MAKKVLVFFLGRNTPSVMGDAEEFFSGEPLVITRKGDQLQPPAGTAAISADEFRPEQGVEYTIVANGGTTSQLVWTLRAFVEAGAPLNVWDVQPGEEPVRLW